MSGKPPIPRYPCLLGSNGNLQTDGTEQCTRVAQTTFSVCYMLLGDQAVQGHPSVCAPIPGKINGQLNVKYETRPYSHATTAE